MTREDCLDDIGSKERQGKDAADIALIHLMLTSKIAYRACATVPEFGEPAMCLRDGGDEFVVGGIVNLTLVGRAISAQRPGSGSR